MNHKSTLHSPALKTYIVSTVLLVILFWVLETALEVYVFHLGDSFLHHLFFPSFHELWMRIITVSLVMIAMVLAYYLSKNRQMEYALKQSEEKFHSLFNQASDSIFLMRPTDDDLIIEDVNEVACNIHGYTRDELIGKSIGMLDDPETRERIPERIPVLMTGKPMHMEAVHVRKDGSTLPIDVAAQRIHIGDKAYILAIDRDITKRKEAEEKILTVTRMIENEKTKLDALINGVGIGLIIQDLNYNVIYENEIQQNSFGNHVGEFCYNAYEGKDQMCEDCPVELSLQDGNTHKAERIIPTEDGERYFELTSSPLKDADGNIIGGIKAVQDMTERKKIDAALNERVQIAEMSADIGIAFTTALTIQDALQKCAEAFVKHLDVLFARMWLFNKEEKLLELKASAGLYTHLDGPHGRIPYGKYKIGQIAKNREPHLTNNVSGDPLVNDQKWVQKEKIVSFAGHPLILKNRLVGVMAMFSRSVLSEITLKALSSVAHQIAIGIDLKLKEQQILLSKENWETTFDTIPDIVIVIDRNHHIMKANNALAKRLGIERESIIGKPCYTVVHDTSAPPSYCPHKGVLADGKERIEELFDKNLNGYFQFSVTPILDAMGNVTATVHVARDITKRKKMEEKLQEAAITDELTGLLNRRGFLALSEQQCRLSDRTKRGITLLFIDLDGMKTINDELGHSEGDQALIDIATILKKSFRGSDIKARMGGDEFAVLLTEPSEDTESAVISHLMKNISYHNEYLKRNYELMISIGISHYDPDSPCSIETLLIEADSSMYEDKKSHKDLDRMFVRNKPG